MDAKENNKEQPQLSESELRTDSESSTDSMMRFVLPSVDGSPPKVVTMDEVAGMLKNLKNMELAHEIALNPEFKLQPYEPPMNSLEGRIKAMVHKAFWNLLREQLERNPPSYDQAIRLLGEIKEDFPQLLSPNNANALVRINATLDEALIRQQAERGTLDFRSYANFVINLLASMCAPARDETVAKLREIDDVIDTFRGILETMALMKLDMANFMVSAARNNIAANSVEYEKQKFSTFLREFHGNVGFPATEDWLQRARPGCNNNEEIIYNAFKQLLNYPTDKEFPELLRIDKERFEGLSWRCQRLILCAALISIAQGVPIISQRRDNRIQLAKQLDILVQHVKQPDQLNAAIDNCYEQIRAFINKSLEKEKLPLLSESQETQIQSQVQQLVNKTSPVRMLMANRMDGFVRVALRSNGNIPPPPAGFAEFGEELVAFIASFRRLVSYNHAVFGEYFLQLLNNKQRNSAEPTAEASSSSSLSTNLAQTAKP
ncbi:T-complex protein 11-like protein 1 [Drosophila hydei]|uniref:T-complex protein 11-like protein 1 n=1 Tax=Drosophila hydei TaxID=7224 RepID=A0A6J1LY07_DROHY|nr:T-complex protein 11-like protein 1 [Drosophila hydei]XP_023168936.2 T-complex protein 11-like protein 1 [Drosophila hydei]